MILVADSGSTKTDWRLSLGAGKISQYRTGGINPLFHSVDEISTLLKEELISQSEELGAGEELDIFFYGAGCNGEEKTARVENALEKVFPKAKIEVNSDLLGAARSLCGNKAGMAAILGTGSNSCLYNGKVITDNVPSLGFILGDEGSGAHIGRKLLNYYFYRELSEDISKSLEEKFSLNREEVVEAVYRKPGANRYLAAFCTHLSKFKTHPFIIQLIYESFSEFIRSQIVKYPSYKEVPLHCTGSIGYFFSDILKKAAKDQSVTVGKTTQSPIAGLMLYHLGE